MNPEELQDAMDAIVEVLAEADLWLRLPDGRRVPFSPVMIDAKIMKIRQQRVGVTGVEKRSESAGLR